MTQQSISEVIGDVECADNSRGVAYKALRDLLCSGCGAVIAASELFTRWSFAPTDERAAPVFTSAPRLAARCRECVPFILPLEAVTISEEAQPISNEVSSPVTNAKPPKSSLIEHLMSSPVAGEIGQADVTTPRVEALEPDAPLTAAEASYRRLAPALHRRRMHPKRDATMRDKATWRSRK